VATGVKSGVRNETAKVRSQTRWERVQNGA
jgi:hypothetical protein